MTLQIPHDTGYPWRLDRFVEYQHRVRSIHPITLCEYANRRGLDEDDCIFLSWLMCVTYSEITAIYMFEKIDWRTMTEESLEKFWTENKPNLIFGSARKHAKNQNWFVPLLKSFSEIIAPNPSAWLKAFWEEDVVETYEHVEKAIRKIRYIGRFAADLFLEMLIAFNKLGRTSLELEQPAELDWKNCANLTSAVFNVLYMDEEADQFDKTGKIAPEHFSLLNAEIQNIQKAIQKRYPEQESSVPLVVGKLCSFRNLFKASRYGGFHHDRQLGNIKKYEQSYPQDKELWDMCYAMRSFLFHESLLGEVGGWDDIRKEMKKLFVQEGKTGVEEVPDHATKEIKDIRGNSNNVVQRKVVKKPEPEAQPEPAPEPEPEEQETVKAEVRSPITALSSRIMVVDPYVYTERKRVDKTFPEKIRKAWEKNTIDFCYFPVEPFHYREVKRHATEMAVDTCVELNIPFSMETRNAVPDWAVEALSRNKNSEIRICMNTLEEKKWKVQYPGAASPKVLMDSFIRCFNGGVFTILKVAPILPVVVEPYDVFQVVDMVKNWTSQVEVCFASFNHEEMELLKERVPKQYEEILGHYRRIGDRWYVVDNYRKEFLERLNTFSTGWKLNLKVLNEITVDGDSNVTLIEIGSKENK